jgi:hypothetical protein
MIALRPISLDWNLVERGGKVGAHSTRARRVPEMARLHTKVMTAVIERFTGFLSQGAKYPAHGMRLFTLDEPMLLHRIARSMIGNRRPT